MPDVRTYPSEFQAQQAAAYLRRHGLPAIARSPIGVYLRGEPIVAISDDLLLETARTLLAEFDSLCPTFDPDWEDEATPELSGLDSRYAPPCAECAELLPLDALVEECPACGAPADVVARIIELHGPDVLADCYPDEADSFTDLEVDAIPFSRDACEYSLLGLPTAGHCPECGREYSKRDMIRRMYGA